MKKLLAFTFATLAIGAIYAWPQMRPSGGAAGGVVGGGAGAAVNNSGFESRAGWEVVREDGALGDAVVDTSVKRSGNASMKLTKTNGVGWIELRSTQPIRLNPNTKYTIRGYFRSEDASVSSLLMFRVQRQGKSYTRYDVVDSSSGYTSQSLLLNSPPGQWEKRVGSLQVKSAEEVTLHVVLYGAPCTVWLDDLVIDAQPYQIPKGPKNPYKLPFSAQQVDDVLAKRMDASAQVRTINGQSTVWVNDRMVAPILYKGTASSADMGDFEQFGKNGVPFATTPVRLGPTTYPDAIWMGPGRYNFKELDKNIGEVLRKNPYANILLDFWIYPYANWGNDNPNEVVRDKSGRRGYGIKWGNMAGFTDDLKSVTEKDVTPWWYPSYHSQKWRNDLAQAMGATIAHIKAQPYGKSVVGAFLTGGHDGQFMNAHFVDASEPAQRDFQNWLRNRYGSIAALRETWGTQVASWSAIRIPEFAGGKNYEALLPFASNGPEVDYRRFREDASWQLRDRLAGDIKQSFGKPIIALSYGLPPTQSFLQTRNLDGVGTAAYYPMRNPGLPIGWKPQSSFALHGKLLFRELDTRSWVGSQYAEVYDSWVGSGKTPETWDAINRKLVGVSIAGRHGYWYFDMNNYYNDPALHEKLAPSVQVATQQLINPPVGVNWRPDVALVTSDDPQHYITGRLSSIGNDANVGSDFQAMFLESSGVPYDKHYLDDILTRPELQNYKVYIFDRNVYVSQVQRDQIEQKLKSSGRTLVWLYDAGYIPERGKSTAAMSRLIGMNVATQEKYGRPVSVMEKSRHPLLTNVRSIVNIADLRMSMLDLRGGVASYMARSQPFWIEDNSAVPLARFTDNRVAMAEKKFADWTSIYMAMPNSLNSELIYNIARASGAYTVGAPTQSINMNERFISLHGLRNESYTLRLPAGKTQVLDAMTGAVLSSGGPTYTFPVEAQKTYWFVLR